MLNFVKYFAECHPRFRQIINRHFRTCVVLFVLFLVVFTWCEWSERRSDQPVTSSSHDDVTVALRAQLGYLKRKYAESSGQGVLDVNDASMPVIFAITPTFYRPVQKAELTRLCQTFLLVPNFHWVVVEDARTKSELVSRFLARCGVPYTHLNAQTPPENKMSDAELEKKNWKKPRGVIQRNEGLDWLRENARLKGGTVDGVIYFADDDNTYDIRVFEDMRYTKRVSVWPVGLVGGLMVEKPKVAADQTVVGWDVAWSPNRPFAIDMAGFAVNYNHFLGRPKAKFAYQVKRGYQETEFLRHLVGSLSELEPKADLCTKVYVYHTRTSKPDLKLEDKRKTLLLSPSNKDMEI